jgi:hypothetical protein
MKTMQKLLVGLLLLVGALVGQTPNTVTTSVSATRTATAATAVFEIQVLDATSNSNLDGAIAIAAGAGASAANLRGVSVSVNQGFVITQYNFTVLVPAAEFAATRDKLIAATRALANNNNQALGWSVTYSVSDDDLNNALQQALPQLLERAKRQADGLAVAMGRTVDKLASVAVPSLNNEGLQVFLTVAATYSLQ